MLRLFALSIAVLAATAATAAEIPSGTGAHAHPWIVPGTSFEIEIGAPVVEPDSGGPQPAFVRAISHWLSSELGLPQADTLPRVAFASGEKMFALRYGHAASDDGVGSMGSADPEVVALYDKRDMIIYLPEGWTGATAAETSILVHEMVHHAQNRGGLEYGCAEAAEKPAYAAQDLWLALFGADLAMEFGIDPLTLLFRTSCMYY